MIKRK